MPVIDADTHVIETERTWEFMEPSEAEFKPIPAAAQTDSGETKQFWLIDNRLQPRRDNIGHDTTEAAREMRDVEVRLRHMDELGVDIHVLYPTIFLRPITRRPDWELALCRSYNRWLAEIWSMGKGRLLWAAVLPLLSMDKALEELNWARKNGACAVFIRGIEGDRRLNDPYFFPLYEAASDLDMPIGIHSATGNFAIHDFFGGQEPGFCKFKLAVVGAFHSLVYDEVPARFPRLRFGFIEVSSQWVPYVIHDLAIRFRRRGKELKKDLLQEDRIYVACQTDDDLAYVLQYAGKERLMIGSDYGHADTSSELEALRRLKQQGGVEPTAIDRILDDNPREFYGL
jgi:predicted TIM-barrel fold metal-dependent hydrolase